MRLAPAALLLVTTALAGCGPQVEGDPELRIYLSAPLSGPRAADGRDVADGAALALEGAGGQAGGTAVALDSSDDATDRGWDAATTAANARLATQDSAAIAYIGELDSGASRTSIPITNEAGLVQVSPGSGAEDLSRESIGSSRLPGIQPSGVRTFARVIPSDRAQGQAAGVWMSDMGIASVDVLGGDTDFGAALLAGLESASPGPAIVEASASPEASYDAQDQPFTNSEPGLVPTSPGPLFGSDALLDLGDSGSQRILRRSCERKSNCPPGGRRQLLFTSAALDSSQLPPAADPFLADFRAAYDREPGRYAAYGYEAMALVLDSIDRAEDPLDRSSVLEALFATEARESVIGTYSIDEVGDTTLAELGAYEVADDLSLEPAAQPLRLP